MHQCTVTKGNGGYEDGKAEKLELQQSAIFKRPVYELVLWWDLATSRDNVSDTRVKIARFLFNKRVTAILLSALLDRCDQSCRRRMGVVHLVGHGGGKRKSGEQRVTISGRNGATITRLSYAIKNT